MARRGHSDSDYLFWTYDFHRVQDQQRDRLKQAVEAAPAEAVRDGTVDEAAERFTDQFRLHAPELTEGAISATVDESRVDITGTSYAFQYATHGAGPHYVQGITATYYVPYVGEKEMFLCKPNTYTSVIPAAEVMAAELRFRFVQPGEDVAATKQAFDHELSKVKQYLGWLDRDAKAFNDALLPYARQPVAHRRSRLSTLEASTGNLGIPIRRASTKPASAPNPVDRPSTSRARNVEGAAQEASTAMYDVALSFAGEDRQYVEQVATLLRELGVSVFYDAFEKAELWGKNLVEHLAEIYQHRSAYVVMFISEHYVRKAWTQHERQHAQARSLVAKDEYILPARFDDTAVPGMTNTVGYIDLRKTDPREFVDLIVTKVGAARPAR